MMLPKWIVANALGLGVAFVAILQAKMLFEFGLNWDMHWVWIEKPLAQTASEYIYMLLAMLAGGMILGTAQALVLRRTVPVVGWIVAAAAGFGVVAVTIQWPLIAVGVLGAIPGPVEPLIITVGGASFSGLCQYLMLRRQDIQIQRWLLLWIGGLIAGVLPTALLMISLQTAGLALSWPLEVFLSGLIIAGAAAWVSGNALFSGLLETGPIAVGSSSSGEAPSR